MTLFFFLFLRLPLDTGTRILHLSSIQWMFFRLFVLLFGNILPDIVDSLEVRISTHHYSMYVCITSESLD
jgi:hypothetical protein